MDTVSSGLPPPSSVEGRRRIIRELVEQGRVATHRDLASALSRRGVVVSQMTLSRDLRAMEIVRVRDLSNRLRYRWDVLPDDRSVRAVLTADHLVVIRCEEPAHLSRWLEEAHIPGLIDILVGGKGVWVAGTPEGLGRVKRYLKKRLGPSNHSGLTDMTGHSVEKI